MFQVALYALALAVTAYASYRSMCSEVRNHTLQAEIHELQALLERSTARRREAFGQIFHTLDSHGAGFITVAAAKQAATRASSEPDAVAIANHFSDPAIQVTKAKFIEFMLRVFPNDLTDKQLHTMLTAFGVILHQDVQVDQMMMF